MAREWFVPNGSGTGNIKEIADILSVHPETVRAWCRELRQAAKAERDRRIIELWLDAHNSLREIADKLRTTHPTVAKVVESFQSGLVSYHPGSFTDVWTFSACDKRFGHDYPGRIPGQIVEHLSFTVASPTPSSLATES